jgi:hypothetical protein
MPDPESTSMLAKLIAVAVAIFTPVAGLWTYVDRRFAKKADITHVDAEFKKVHDELKQARATQAKIFDQIRDSDQRAQDRHERLMERLAR